MSSPSCQACAENHPANHICQDCQEDALMCEEMASTHRRAKQTNAHRIFPLCQVCADTDAPHAASHRCDNCDVGERFMCESMALPHTKGKKTAAHKLVSLGAPAVVASAAAAGAAGSAVPVPSRVMLCEICLERRPDYDECATVVCVECGLSLCRHCDEVTHASDIAQAHTRRPCPSDGSAANCLPSVSVGVSPPSASVAGPREANAHSYVLFCFSTPCFTIFILLLLY
jgi:hypothetical protein